MAAAARRREGRRLAAAALGVKAAIVSSFDGESTAMEEFVGSCE